MTKKAAAKPAKKRRGKAKISRNRVAEVMIKKGVIAQEMADRIGTNGGHISRIMKNERPCISLPIALKISQVLQTPVEQLFFLEIPAK